MKKKWHYFFVFYSAAWAVFFFVSINPVLPENPVKIPKKLSTSIMEYFPQGWGFFSKDPRDGYFYVIDLQSEKLGASWPNMTLSNWAGLKRFGRSQGIELGRLYAQVGEQSMIECTETPLVCLKNQDDVINVINDSPSPTIIGEVGIVKQESVPWAWSKKVDKETMPSKIVRLNVDVPSEE
ncbi:MAG: SdpA family antimicrobial peptide system protein [Bacillota bacterium]